MPPLTILRSYAQQDPALFPSSVVFGYTPSSITLYDAYPKSIFHFLILPRVTEKLTADILSNLGTLLRHDKAVAKAVLLSLNDDAQTLKQEIETEMISRYGFKWDIWAGFHGAPSMMHLHLHVLSADLCSDKMKQKKHYNSFHPKHGFFLPIEEVLSWFDAEAGYYANKSKMALNTYEPILKNNLSCWRCGAELPNMPKLKIHLQEEWDKMRAKARARAEKAKTVS